MIALVDFCFGTVACTRRGDGGVWSMLHSQFNENFKGRTRDAINSHYLAMQRKSNNLANNVKFMSPEDESDIAQEFKICVLIDNRPKDPSFLVTS